MLDHNGVSNSEGVGHLLFNLVQIPIPFWSKFSFYFSI